MTKQETQMEEWSTEYINNLPDSAFMFIEEGGEKDEEGKTKPRSLRHLPYKDKEGNINLPHVKNALARLNQVELKDGSKLPEDKSEEIRKKLEKILEDNQDSEEANQDPEEANQENNKNKTENSDDNGTQYKHASSDHNSNFESDSNDNDNNSTKETGKKSEEKPKKPENKPSVSEKESVNDSNKSKSIEQFSGSLKEALELNEDMIQTLNESRKEIDSYKQLNEDLLKRLNKKEQELEEKQKEVTRFEQEKKQSRVNKLFDQYCDVFDISEGEQNNVYKMLSNMSEDMLERTETLLQYKPKAQSEEKNYTQPSSNLEQFDDNSEAEKVDKNTWHKMSGKERARYYFNRYLNK